MATKMEVNWSMKAIAMLRLLLVVATYAAAQLPVGATQNTRKQ